ncbi:acyl-CoA thioesterase II [Corynebacterium sanguinis]|uniref:acyl-CoA thioesterase n=1 Tax=Corynebacterium sanguinis TaxID=2594913 RepID=UPI00223A8B89|nr:acyl-CoA thioesterase II [Corynebacterium sanguinis]MCT1411070.1 acyl-CoA thioesterase II [Corynebacterium sanguinis]MCT1444045.1 acyl-CoA thioesterase II [Corynebacterium sanguinis]MCT1492289.1 acyl-CoA thioesterase II [Corynebacterium sanguinis]MCT1596588.1 acyl-CoA thioesterase II [Corynebacterium sanguinis]MCT2247226.1 acyl-CoA thioesterase II [Corynebacterium sanguinis]
MNEPSYEGIQAILDLERIDKDIFRGRAMDSKVFVRTFGGHVAGQALVAATRTVDDDKRVHSLHGYFLRAGKADAETVYLVSRVREGRRFATRKIEAMQNGEVIFSMQASFHRIGDEGPEHRDTMREVPRPDEIEFNTEELPESLRGLITEWSDWDFRVVPSDSYAHDGRSSSQQVIWFRSKRALPDDDTFHICTLAYMSDMTLLFSSMVPHPSHKVQMASLDHAMWFLRPFRADEWLLYDQSSPSAHAGRALTQGQIFDLEGNLVAVTVQEGLTRTLRDGGETLPGDDKS